VGVADLGRVVGDKANAFVFEGLKIGLMHDLGAGEGLGDEGEEKGDHWFERSVHTWSGKFCRRYNLYASMVEFIAFQGIGLDRIPRELMAKCNVIHSLENQSNWDSYLEFIQKNNCDFINWMPAYIVNTWVRESMKGYGGVILIPHLSVYAVYKNYMPAEENPSREERRKYMKVGHPDFFRDRAQFLLNCVEEWNWAMDTSYVLRVPLNWDERHSSEYIKGECEGWQWALEQRESRGERDWE
jgi:hypothetical protein